MCYKITNRLNISLIFVLPYIGERLAKLLLRVPKIQISGKTPIEKESGINEFFFFDDKLFQDVLE